MKKSSSSPSNTDSVDSATAEGESSGREADRIEAQANTNAVSRAIAVMILMILPGLLGSFLDKWLGTQFLVMVGFVVGIGIAIFGLIYVARIADVAAKRSREMRARTNSQIGNAKPESDRGD